MAKTWADEAFVQAVKSSVSVAGVLRAIGLKATGANYKTVHYHVTRLGLTTEHWLGQAHLKGGHHLWTSARSLESCLGLGVHVQSSVLRRKLLKAGLLQEKCAVCNLGPEWFGKPLVLQLDHINGRNDDNRLENLRLICPNCHTQTPTFGAKNRGTRGPTRPAEKHFCKECQKPLLAKRKTGCCRKCAPARRQRRLVPEAARQLPQVPPREEFLRCCAAYRDSLGEGPRPIPRGAVVVHKTSRVSGVVSAVNGAWLWVNGKGPYPAAEFDWPERRPIRTDTRRM